MPTVVSVNLSPEHKFSKVPASEIMLIEDEGVSGDAHQGKAVQHLSRVKNSPHLPNLRQVHLLHMELIEELQVAGFRVSPATMGENITTSGLDILALPTGSILSIGDDAKIEVTGLRTPCSQIDDYQQGLRAAVMDREADGRHILKAGIMGIVLKGGVVRPGDAIAVEYPAEPHMPLVPV